MLSGLSHPNLPSPLSLDPSVHSSLRDSFKGDLLLYSEAVLGDLLSYVSRVGGLSERVSRFYLRQVCEAVLFVAEKTALTHSNLSLENLLIEGSHNCLVAGWANSQGHKREPAFALAEMAVSMVAGRRPFVSRDVRHDQLGKFLTEDRIHKFWELLEKAAKRSNRGFPGFTEEFRAAVGALFLQKLTDLRQLHKEFLAVSGPTLEEVHKELLEKEAEVAAVREQKRLKERALQKYGKALAYSEKAVVEAEEAESGELAPLHKEPSRSADIFLEEFSALRSECYSIPPRQQKANADDFPLFDSDPRVILAHLRTRLQQCESHQSEEYFVHPLLLLRKEKCYASLEGSELRVSLPLEWHSDLGKREGGHELSIEVALGLSVEKEELFATVVETEDADLDRECLDWLIHWLRDTLTSKA